MYGTSPADTYMGNHTPVVAMHLKNLSRISLEQLPYPLYRATQMRQTGKTWTMMMMMKTKEMAKGH